MSAWMVRAGEGAALARDFADHNVIALGWHHVGIGNLEQLDAYDITRRLETLGMPAPEADAEELLAFRDRIYGGDVIVVPEGTELLVGRATGSYEYRDTTPIPEHHHIRVVRWLGRWDRDALPDHVRADLRHRRTLVRLSLTESWSGIADRLEAGERPPRKTRTAAAPRTRSSSSGGSTRTRTAAPTPKPAPPQDQVCDNCGLRLRLTQFDKGSTTCRDCS